MKIDFKKLSKSFGYKSLKKTVLLWCNEDGGKCFNTGGCKSRIKNCEGHCSKFKWIIDRVRHYSERTGLEPHEILDAWEQDRSYWYMNYYQECNQPKLTGKRVVVFSTMQKALDTLLPDGFRCPACGSKSDSPYYCTNGVTKGKKKCDWKVYGLFGDLGKGIHIFVKDRARGEQIFMPIILEENYEK